MFDRTEFLNDPWRYDANELTIEDIDKMKKREIKLLLDRTLDYDYDDESDMKGYTINLNNLPEEETINYMIEKLTNKQYECEGAALYELAENARNNIGGSGEFGSYTNLCVYFSRQEHAAKYVKELRKLIRQL